MILRYFSIRKSKNDPKITLKAEELTRKHAGSGWVAQMENYTC